MNYTNKKPLQKAFNNFLDELKELAEAYPESAFDNYLIEEVAPALCKDKELFSTSIFTKLDIAVKMHQLNSDQMKTSLEHAMSKMSNDAICWFLAHIYTLDNTVTVLNTEAGERSILEQTLRDKAHDLKTDKDQLQKWLNGDLYERIQRLGYDISRLKEDS